MLDNESVHIDEITRKLEIEASQVSAVLTILEIKGFVKHLGGMVYARR